MGRPRNTSNPMNPSRLLKQGSTNNMAIMNLNLPALAPSQIPRSLEEDLESQARASIALFGFGSRENNGVTWSKVNVNASTFDLGMGGGSASSSMGSISGQSLLLMERVCPLGMNSFLWNTMHNGEIINHGNATSNGNGATEPIDADNDDDEATDMDVPSAGYLFGSKVLQQYLVKAVTLLPATVEEVVELLVRTDSDDMETAMTHLAGVKTQASGVIYRRRKKRLRRRHLPPTTANRSTMAAVGAGVAKNLSATTLSYESDSSSSSSGEDDDADTDDAADDATSYHRVSLHTAPPPRRPSRRARYGRASSGGVRLERPTSLGSTDDFATFAAEAANRGNLSLKWVVGERAGRMFGAKVNYCLLDYECIIINDWDEGDESERSPMYVRSLQSCYIPQCQPWIDEFNANRPTNLQPTGFMVREAKYRDGYVEVQFVGAILEKAQLPNGSQRAKLRSLVARISKLEEIITSRRLSQSLLAHQPMWVRNRERASCHCCDAKFSLSRRRHHCRICGEVCCSECSPKMDVVLPDVGVTSVRVCVSCLRKRRQSTDFSHSASSGSSFSMSSASMMSHLSPRRGPSIYTPPTPPLAPPPPTTPPQLHGQLSSSSSSEYLSSSSYGSLTSNGGILGERKPTSLTSSMLQRFKSS